MAIKNIFLIFGYSDVYLQNAAKLGIDLEQLDAVIISHGHNDHTGGLAFYPKTKHEPLLIAHPGIMEAKSRRPKHFASRF